MAENLSSISEEQLHHPAETDVVVPGGTRLVNTLKSLDNGEAVPYQTIYLETEARSFELRRAYILNTARLINRIKTFNPDYVFFIDKSARPVSWLVKELWSDIGDKVHENPDDPDSPMVTPKLPATKFINVDRNQWGERVGRSEDADTMIDTSKVTDEEIAQLRLTFLDPRDRQPEMTLGEVKSARSIFSNKRVMIVDEVKVSGDSLNMARAFFHRAFPEVPLKNVSATYWMTRAAAASVGLPTVPVWYKAESESDNTGIAKAGRGVGERDFTRSGASKSSVQRRGWLFLSSKPYKGPLPPRPVYENGEQKLDENDQPVYEIPHSADPLARLLRLDVKKLAADFRSGKFGFTPEDLS